MLEEHKLLLECKRIAAYRATDCAEPMTKQWYQMYDMILNREWLAMTQRPSDKCSSCGK